MSDSDQRPMLSIVIPTRERGLYLQHSLNTAIACRDDRIEIVVSDNASHDDTAAVVGANGDPRIRYVRTPERVSVCANFSSAFSNATGDYILYIGDDDAVLPGGIADLIAVLTEQRPDIVSWPEVSYEWPRDNADGLLRIRRRHLGGGVQSRDPAEYMSKICAGESGIASVHCGCVSRDIVHAVASKAGRYHYYTIPDASAFAALALAKSYIYLNRPVTVYGRSPASNTSALLTAGSSAYATFGRENESDAREEFLDLRCRSIFAFGLDGLMQTRRLFGLSGPPISFEKWKERIVKDILSMRAEVRQEQVRFVNEWLEKNHIAPLEIAPSKLAAAHASPPMTAAKKRRRKTSLRRIAIPASQSFMPNVDAAVQVAEYVIGPAVLTHKQPRLAALMRWFGIATRARLVSKRDGEKAARRYPFTAADVSALTPSTPGVDASAG